MSKSIEQFWYRPKGILRFFLWPLHLLMRLLVQTRFWLFRFNVIKSYRSSLPVIVVGNISVGGTGKTPFVIWLVKNLQQQGFNTVVLSRGYGVTPSTLPLLVTQDTSVSECGDEPKMMMQAGCTIVVDPDRTRAAKWIEQQYPNSVIICDDGLQHYKLQRNFEICLIDGFRGLGNRLLMPFGPLREPKSRLNFCDLIIQNSGVADSIKQDSEINQYGTQDSLSMMTIHPISLVNLVSHEEIVLEKNKPFPFEKVTAICGIGNPMKFHHTLTELGAEPKLFGFPDHHKFVADDLTQLGPKPIVMTEKDAVKCSEFARENWWYLKISASVDDNVFAKIVERLPQINASKS
ncbi:MAG: tetraacyldisaccharide 4'-kinase [Gammaproteobacteria bacterium]|nr:tetraacyldisaccharide 4'-kinase [Gammaproteobacteria bacterium]